MVHAVDLKLYSAQPNSNMIVEKYVSILNYFK